MGLVQMTLYAIGCLPSFPCRLCVKPANRAPGGKASLVIGSRKNVSKLQRNLLLFSRPGRSELTSPAEWAKERDGADVGAILLQKNGNCWFYSPCTLKSGTMEKSLVGGH